MIAIGSGEVDTSTVIYIGHASGYPVTAILLAFSGWRSVIFRRYQKSLMVRKIGTRNQNESNRLVPKGLVLSWRHQNHSKSTVCEVVGAVI